MPRTQLVVLIAVALCLVHAVLAGPNYLDVERQRDDSVDEYNDNVERLLENTRKRSCLRRSQRCDHRPNDCCPNSSCRCNLWGTNCYCERLGLFQQWGK